MIPLLLTTAAAAAKAFTYVKGGEVILKTTDALTGANTHQAVSGFVDTATADTRNTIRGIADPVISGRIFKAAYDLSGLHHVVQPIVSGVDSLFDGAGQIVAGVAETVSKTGHLLTGQGELPTEPTQAPYQSVEQQRRDAERALADANKRAQEAANRASSLLADAAKSADAKKKQAMLNQARAAQRLIKVSELSASDAVTRMSTDETMPDALRYAMFALDSAQAAKAPPTDPLDVLGSSNVSADEKERVATIIDQLNRDQEPDIRSIVDMGVGVDSVPAVAGHDCGGNCGQTCCTGEPDFNSWGDEHHKPDPKATQAIQKARQAWAQFDDGDKPNVAGGEWAQTWPEAKPKPKKRSEWDAWNGKSPEKVHVSGDDDFEDLDDDDDDLDVGPSCSTGTCNRPAPRPTRY